jgi:hypothetical protein
MGMVTAYDLEWATFLYNAMGEDTSYIDDSIKVREDLKKGSPGKAIVDFLNHWRMRVSSKKVPHEIDEKYNSKVKTLLEAFPNSLLELDLSDMQTRERFTDLFNCLDGINNINDTGVSKILHIIKPDLFVMWDNDIRMHYLKGQDTTYGPEAYMFFLGKMQKIARSLQEEDVGISSKLSLYLKTLYEGNLKNITEASKMETAKRAVHFLETEGKPITKFLDEYNWIVITKQVGIPPAWHPHNV